MHRRQYLVGLAAGTVGLAGCLADDEGSGDEPSGDENGTPIDDMDDGDDEEYEEIAVQLEPVATDLTQPVGFAAIPGDSIRYVIERVGRIRILDGEERVSDPLLDITDMVIHDESWEQGLLGIALHPEFEENGRLFYRYSSSRLEGTSDEYSHTNVIDEVQVTEDRRGVVEDSRRRIMEIPQPGPVHNAGDILFGPDEFLYVTSGDGGGGYGDHGPGHAEDWYNENSGGNGQDTSTSLLGGILRIDIDSDPTEHPRTDSEAPEEPVDGRGYAIPADNPLTEEEDSYGEYFAWGFRNPWQATFHDDTLIVADVGSAMRAIYSVEPGGNYGWNVKDGSRCFDTETPASNPEECPDRTPEEIRDGEPLTNPVIEYEHPGGSNSAVIGGHVYTGEDIPPLEGKYVFSDLTPMQFDGLFVAQPETNASTWRKEIITIADGIHFEEFLIFALGRHDGELFVLGGGFDEEGGGVYRIVSHG